MIAEDGQWATIQDTTDFRGSDAFRQFQSTRIFNVIDQASAAPLSAERLDISTSDQVVTLEDQTSNGPLTMTVEPASDWLLRKLGNYLGSAFFFDPFRHSAANLLGAQEVYQLAQDGSNLAQVLFTLHNNDRRRFDRIETFAQRALSDIGKLETPLVSNSTEVGFRSTDAEYAVRLHDMGAGIEQLLMVATVLLTTDDESTVFLEEPETHLHAGAQRFLIERLYEGNRQVFVSTHSPTFTNVSKPRSMLYQVTRTSGRTKIALLGDSDSLGLALEDIGVRNSDVLLSDAVLFVEGPSDRQALGVWADILGMNLAEHNVTVLIMGGGEYADRSAPVRSELLAGISQRAPVPHLFVLDRDQRSLADVSTLERKLEGRVHILRARELENYLLIPKALRVALCSKCRTNHEMLEKLDNTLDEDIEQSIEESANDLYGRVLLKRIRAELGGLRGGLLTREAVDSLAAEANLENLPRRVYQVVEAQVAPHLVESDIKRLVLEQIEALDAEWSERSRRVIIAPGEEIIDAVFRDFGVRYKKPDDTVRIAREMRKDEIAPDSGLLK